MPSHKIFLLALALLGLLEVSQASICSGTITNHVTNYNPVAVSLDGYITYATVTLPSSLAAEQGWSLRIDSDGQVDLNFQKYIANVGNAYQFNCDTTLYSIFDNQYTMFPCRPEAPDWAYRSMREWVVALGVGDAASNGNLVLQPVDMPTVQEVSFGNFSFKSDRNAPVSYKFTTSSDTSSIYLFVSVPGAAAAAAAAAAYVRLTTAQCTGIVSSANSQGGYLETTLKVNPSTTYYLYIATTASVNVFQMLYPVSAQCSATCDEEGGVCNNDQCKCKQGYYGATCDLLACDSIIPKPCHCTLSGTVTTKTTKISKPKGPNVYYNFTKPSAVGNANGWKLKVHPVDYWTNYYFNAVDKGAMNTCPRDKTVVPVMRTDYGGYGNYTIESGLRPCSADLEKYANVGDYVFRIDGDINSNVAIVDLPAPEALPLTFNNYVSGAISDWAPLLYKIDVPQTVVNVTLTFSFNTMSSIYHTLTVTTQPCRYDGVTNRVYDLDNATSGKKVITLNSGVTNYLLLDSQYSPEGIAFKFVLNV